jgi:hypothetical protein
VYDRYTVFQVLLGVKIVHSIGRIDVFKISNLVLVER